MEMFGIGPQWLSAAGSFMPGTVDTELTLNDAAAIVRFRAATN